MSSQQYSTHSSPSTKQSIHSQSQDPTTSTKVRGDRQSAADVDEESEEERANRIMEEHQRLYADKRDK